MSIAIEEPLAEVEILLTEGMRNIDVGMHANQSEVSRKRVREPFPSFRPKNQCRIRRNIS